MQHGFQILNHRQRRKIIPGREANKVSPNLAPAPCLERISRAQCRERESKQSSAVLTKLRDRWRDREAKVRQNTRAEGREKAQRLAEEFL